MWLAGGRLRGRTRAVAMVVTGALLASQALLLPGSGASLLSGVLLPAGTDHAASPVSYTHLSATTRRGPPARARRSMVRTKFGPSWP